MSKTTAPTFGTVRELSSGPDLTLALAQIDTAALRTDIARCLDGLRRVNTPSAAAIVRHFTGILARAENALPMCGRAHYNAELKRVALGLHLVHVGDL